MKNIFLEYLVTLTKTMQWKVSLALMLMLCLSFTEGIGLMLLLPILQLVGISTQQDSTSGFVETISSVFKSVNLQPTLISVLSVYVIIITAQALLSQWQSITNLSIEYEFALHLRQKLYRAITNTNWLFFSRMRSSDFTCALTTELDRVGSGTYHFLNLIVNVVVGIVYVLLALQLSKIMTVLVFVAGTTLLILFKRNLKEAHLSGEELSLETSSLYSASIEHLSSMKTTKSYSTEEQNANIFTNVAKRVAEINIRLINNQASVKCIFDIGTVLILSSFLYISFKVLAINTASILLLLFLFARIMPRFSSTQQSYQEVINMLPAFSGVMKLQTLCKVNSEPRIRSIEKLKLRDCIRFENVSFTYGERNTKLLFSNLNLAIQAGKTTAIVGPSGCGKSTIADLVMGLISPDQGYILIDNIPLSFENIPSWRNQIGYVAQDTFLFHDTIRANLLWACPFASDKEIYEVIKLSALEEFVFNLPNGLETIVGDRGVLLSGGERQRLALARALLRKPSILILDEATSSLDSENEKRIQTAIEELRGNTTILIISHRLSTIRNSDIIYVLEKGQIIETGKFNELCLAQ